MLANDAMTTLLTACKNALVGGKTSLTPNDVKQALTQITGANAIQGVSGQISFDANGNPANKAVVILSVSSQGFIQMQHDRGGKFLK